MNCPIICLFYPKTRNFCICGSLTAGIAMITVLYFIGSLVAAVYVANFYYGSDVEIYLLLFVVTVFLPIAKLSKKNDFFLPWLVYVFCFALLQIIECSLILLLMVFGKINFLEGLEEILLSALFIALHTYFFIVVFSYYLENDAVAEKLPTETTPLEVVEV